MDDLRNDRGLVWSLSCSPGKQQLADSERFNGRRSWTPFAVDFEIPREGCGSQLLRLRLDARVPAEQWVGGRAWFDDLRIARRSQTNGIDANSPVSTGQGRLPGEAKLWQSTAVADHIGVGKQGPK